VRVRVHCDGMVAPGRVELPTFGLGNRCSIHLSYGAAWCNLQDFTPQLRFPVRWNDRLQKTVEQTPLIERYL
jgi:hypothetical protein